MSSKIKIRPATPNDVSLIFSFIRKNAEFDCSLSDSLNVLKVTEEKINKTVFSTTPFAYVLFAELAGREIGFALYSFRYSSFIGQPSLWLDDLYVDTRSRRKGAASQLMHHLAQVAQEHDCTHLAWNADARNTTALEFYRRLGAEVTDQHGYRCFLSWLPWKSHLKN